MTSNPPDLHKATWAAAREIWELGFSAGGMPPELEGALVGPG